VRCTFVAVGRLLTDVRFSSCANLCVNNVSNRHHLSNDDSLENEKKDCRNCLFYAVFCTAVAHNCTLLRGFRLRFYFSRGHFVTFKWRKFVSWFVFFSEMTCSESSGHSTLAAIDSLYCYCYYYYYYMCGTKNAAVTLLLLEM